VLACELMWRGNTGIFGLAVIAVLACSGKNDPRASTGETEGAVGGASSTAASGGGSAAGETSSGGARAAGGFVGLGGAVSGGVAGASTVAGVSFSTNFDVTESPISESGKWSNVGLDWSFVATGNGYAFGTQTGNDGYDDSYAHLTGFPPNQTATAVIHVESGNTAAYNEVEILLRWSDAEHYATGYECNLAHDGSYAQIIRWPGALGKTLGDFAFLATGAAANGVHDGDVFSATITGSTITSYLNGKMLATATDGAITRGDPGIAFYWERAAASQKFSFTSFSAQGLP
jgi:hypothetical protein